MAHLSTLLNPTILLLLLIGSSSITVYSAEPEKKLSATENRWEEAILAFEKQDAQTPLPENPILFVGSSSIRMWDLKKSFPDLPTLNRGFGGSQTSDVIHFFSRVVLPYHPRAIVFYSGDNDIASGKSPQQVSDDFITLARLIHDNLPKCQIIALSIKPSPTRWALYDKGRETNTLIQKFCSEDPRRTFVNVVPGMLDENGKPRKDFFLKDGLHLNEEGYTLWNELVAKAIAQTTNTPKKP